MKAAWKSATQQVTLRTESSGISTRATGIARRRKPAPGTSADAD